MVYALAFAIIAGYLFGSINSALIVSRLTQKGDIRTQGSGNAGTTNMFRSMGKKAGLATAVGDLLKAIIAVGLTWLVFHLAQIELPFDPAYITGLFLVIGHIYPVFFNFKGGKGAMPAVGVVLMADPLAFAILLAVALLIFTLSRIMSLVSLISAALLPLVILVLKLLRGQDPLWPVILTVLYAALIIIAHRSNIVRLVQGNENLIKLKGKEKR